MLPVAPTTPPSFFAVNQWKYCRPAVFLRGAGFFRTHATSSSRRLFIRFDQLSPFSGEEGFFLRLHLCLIPPPAVSSGPALRQNLLLAPSLCGRRSSSDWTSKEPELGRVPLRF